MLKTIWSTGLYDGLFCFEILDAINRRGIEASKRLPMWDISHLSSIMIGGNVFIDCIIELAKNGLIKEVMLEVKNKKSGLISRKTIVSPEILKTNDTLNKDLYDLYIERWYDDKTWEECNLFLEINYESIVIHLDACLDEWRKSRFFRRMSRTNILTPEKQEEKVLEYIYSLKNDGIDLGYFMLGIGGEPSASGLWYYMGSPEGEYEIHPFMAIWSLHRKWIIKIFFWENNEDYRNIEYRIEYMESSIWSLLEETNKLNRNEQKEDIIGTTPRIPSWFFFDLLSWKVYYDWLLIEDLSIWTTKYKLLKILYQNRWIVCTYEDIKKFVTKSCTADTPPKYCQKVCDKLDDNIKKYIQAKWVGYILDI